MIITRNVFHCKPGKAKELVAKLKASGETMKKDNMVKGSRVMTDAAATFWTVVFELEHESLAEWEASFKEYGSSSKTQDTMQGYMDLVTGGHREIWKVE
jgi:hypothetical protein